MFGAQDEKLFIEISQKPLGRNWAWTLDQVLAQLGQQNAVESAGTLQTPYDVLQVRVAGQFTAIEQLAAMPIRAASGAQLRLGDVAQIRRGYADPPTIKVRHQGAQVIALGVSMVKGGDIVALGQGARAVGEPTSNQLASRRALGAGARPAGRGDPFGQ